MERISACTRLTELLECDSVWCGLTPKTQFHQRLILLTITHTHTQLQLSFNAVCISDQVKINIPSLPAIGNSDRLHCTVASYRSEGKMSDSGQVSCELPEPSLIPQTPDDQGRPFLNPRTSQSTILFKWKLTLAGLIFKTVSQGENLNMCLVFYVPTWITQSGGGLYRIPYAII